MMKILHKIAFALCVAALPIFAHAVSPAPLVTSATQVVDLPYSDSESTHLSDNNITLSGINPNEISINIITPFKVNIPDGLTLSPTEGLVVYFARVSGDGAPTVVQVEGHVKDSSDPTFQTLGYAYLQFRGGVYTHEFSDLICPSDEVTYDQIRLTVLKVASGTVAKFGKFNLFRIDKSSSVYPAGRQDPLRSIGEYSLYFEDYNYKPNKGVLDPHNWYGVNEQYYKDVTTTPWGDKNTISWNGVDTKLPTFEEQSNGTGNPGSQMPHVIETTLYAMPGDIISLSPFYDLPVSDRYTEKYSHWYGYKPQIDGTLQPQTYGHVKDAAGNYLLDFLIDPAGIIRTENAGFFSGENIPLIMSEDQYQYVDFETESGTESYYIIHNYQSLKAFAELVNSGTKATPLNAIVARDFSCSGREVKIGTEEHPYSGKFDGNAYAISNIGSELFSYVTDGTVISNLVVVDSRVSSGEITGLLIDHVAHAGGSGATNVEVKNVILTGIIQNPKKEILKGGVIGEVDKGPDGSTPSIIKLDHVVFVGNVYHENLKNGPHNGGIIGNLNGNSVEFIGCYAQANVDGDNTTPPANGIGASESSASITGVESCTFNFKNNEHDTSLRIDGELYIPGDENKHRILVSDKPAQWSGLAARIRGAITGSGGNSGVTLVGPIPCSLYEKRSLYYCDISDFWDGFIYETDASGNKTLNSSRWANVCIDPANSEGNRTPYITGFPLIPAGYKDIYITNLVNSKISTKSIPIPGMTRREVGDYTTFVDRYHPDRWYGTEATFYQPMKTNCAPTSEANLKLEKDDYYIAADFGHEFNVDHNIQAPSTGEDGETTPGIIHEPVLAYRHIFHIKDGKTFADAYTSNQKDNLDYIVGNARSVSARAGYDFQIRLTTQVPVETQTSPSPVPVKTNFYYKKGENVYDRVPRVGIEVYDENGNPLANGPQFKFDATVATQGYRNNYLDTQNGFGYVEGESKVKYYTGNGGDEVYRTLYCDHATATPGKYKVRLVAEESNGDIIKICGTNEPLYLEEYHITFLPDAEASVKPEEELYNEEDEKIFWYHSPEYLETELGAPAVKVDFDQYCTKEDAANLDKWFITKPEKNNHDNDNKVGTDRYVKWPSLWSSSTYSFGYGGHGDYDYNEYIIANNATQGNFQLGKTLLDRNFYDTEKKTGTGKRGYFLYLNAASDPGIAANLTIKDLCPGSTICVSAWAAELSGAPEVANICFNFVAVDAKGHREIVHSFVSGYIDNENFGSSAARHDKNTGAVKSDIILENGEKHNRISHRTEWMHIYYSFIPDISKITLGSIDHYELELENNCVSSFGADYAIDDICAYIIAPKIMAQQLTPVCDANQATTGIRITSRFDKLLSSVGIERALTEEEGKDVKLHFAVLDKAKYDAAYDGSNGPEAVLKSFIRLNSENGAKWVSANFTSFFGSLTAYAEPETGHETYNTPMSFTSGNVDYFLLNVLPYDTDLRPGKEYYIVLYEEANGKDAPAEATYGECFKVTGNPCDRYCTVSLQGSGIFKVDGFAHNIGGTLQVCEGQSPVVQVELKMSSTPDTPELPDEYNKYLNAPEHYYDWFTGTIEEFMENRKVSEEENSATYSYYNLLNDFRKDNSTATELPVLVGDETDAYDPLRDLISEGRLHLYRSSFVFPPIKDPGEDHMLTLTALPILPLLPVTVGNTSYTLCSQPNQLNIEVSKSSPKMYDGFDWVDIDYGTQTDVPLRLGYLHAMSVKIGDLNGDLSGKKCLVLPLRNIASYKPNNDATMIKATTKDSEADPFVYLAATNDPAYIGLNKHPLATVATPGLLPIGVINEMTAKSVDKGKNSNNVTILFDDDMQFSEGYWYTLRFNYDEDTSDKDDTYCQGQVVFTLKIVPAYMKWTAAESRNWNNDANWRRMKKGELNVPTDQEKLYGNFNVSDHTIVEEKTKRYDLVLQGEVSVPDTESSFAPLDFTKVVIPDLAKEVDDKNVMKPTHGYPVMFTADSKTLGRTAEFAGYTWNNKATSDNSNVGEATDRIEYDMVAFDSGNLLCRPWYANTCNQIHFNHGAELVHQECFGFGVNYKKAWADIAMTGDRWYTLGSPLNYTVAGDMYAPTATGLQSSELFKPINFDKTNGYDRFKPAVYQRGWNKADDEAKTYYLGDNNHDYHSAYVQLNWSRVYNDVEEAYTPGSGFSIRTVTDGITTVAADKTIGFRLPKADNTYSYFTPGGATESNDDTGIARGEGDARHSLIAFTDNKYSVDVTIGTSGNYFLVSNPFIAKMKMANFLDNNHNKDIIEKIYWIMTNDRQAAIYWDEKSNTFMSTEPNKNGDDVNGSIAPMQGFFVKAKQAATSLTLEFTPDMIDEGNTVGDNPGVKLLSHAQTRDGIITVTAMDGDGEAVSRAILNVDPDAKADYVSAEDAPLLLDNTFGLQPTVYSVASEHALAINSLDQIVETEIGLYAPDDAKTVLLFEGINDADGLMLLDTADGTFVDLYDGMSVEVEGSASGRYYITRSTASLIESTLAVVLKDRTVSIVSSTEGIAARVYTPAGLYCGEWSVDDTSLQFDLEPGIFIVEARGDNQRKTCKFIVK